MASKYKKMLLMVTFLIISCIIWHFLPERQTDTANNATQSTALVSMIKAVVKPLPVTLTTQGHVVALNQVDIQAQLTGTVKTVDFKEGSFVKAGQLLFTLDDTSQRASLDRAAATAEQVKALVMKAQNDLRRGRMLKAENYISLSDWDALQSNLRQYQAQLKAAQQDVQTAKINLSYTRIEAPADGKTGALNVHPGSLVQPGGTVPLVSLVQFNPIGVSFTLPEKDLKQVLAAQKQDAVTVRVEDADGKSISGLLSFIDNSVSTASGTITLKAHFNNSAHLLWPGLYQNVTVEAGVTPDAVVLPLQAVQNGPDGHFVYVIDSHHKAQIKPVTLLRVQGASAVISGIAKGTEVVNEGTNNLRPGMTVEIASNSSLVDKAGIQP